MDDDRIGIAPVDAYPPYQATGSNEIRARSVSKRHIKILNDLQAELGGVGRREAIAALCEFYASHPQQVLDTVGPDEFR